MEKIKQALEKARHERNKKNVSDTNDDLASLSYTHTQEVKCSKSHMREHRVVSAFDSGEFSDSLKILSTQVLQRMVENNWSSLAITSADFGEGKTTTAINLGLSIAKEIDYTVLLVDTNLRRPRVHEYFGFQPEYGLSDYLTSDINLSDVLVHPIGIDHFIILPAGNPHMASSELLGSPKMARLAEELTCRYPRRIIIFDTPPILKTADTIALLPCIDAAIIVIEDDETRTGNLKTAVDMLSVTNIIGTVLNKSVHTA